MKFKKLVASATLLASAAVLFAGCGSSSNSATKDENKISVWAWDETFNIKAVNEAKKVYENKEVEVDVVTMSEDDIIQKLNRALASRNTDGLANNMLIDTYR